MAEIDRNHMKNFTVLVTGAAGFIGSALSERLLHLRQGVDVVGIDSMNSYYDLTLKEWRLNKICNIAESCERSSFVFCRCDIGDGSCLYDIVMRYQPSVIVHLAAQAGVRYSIDHPDEYIKSNIVGTYHVLEACRKLTETGRSFSQLVFASSSSVYGLGQNEYCQGNLNELFSYSESRSTDKPVSLYAATKKSAEVIAYSYASMYGIPMTGLRFFTVYGPAGRPDMAYYKFTEKLAGGEQIDLFNPGRNYRDYTYIDDITEGILRVISSPPAMSAGVPYRIYNIGNQHPVSLPDFIRILTEEMIVTELLPPDFCLNEHINTLPAQTGDVTMTYADCSAFMHDFDFVPRTDLREGLNSFLAWYRYYNHL